MILLYQIGIFLYFLGITIASPFNKKASLFIKGRKKLILRIKKEVKGCDVPIIWIHCASVGEFEQARPIIETYKKGGGEKKIFLTFFSPSGYQLRKNYKYADWVFYMPKDSLLNAYLFLDAVKPCEAIFIKYEYWYNFLFELNRRSIPTYIVSAIYRPRQAFFRWYGSMFRQMLSFYTLIFVQDKPSKDLLAKINVNNVVVSGDTRFDRVFAVAKENTTKDNDIVKRFSDGGMTVVAGSTWEKDEIIISKTMQNFPGLKLVLVPHEVREDHISAIFQYFAGYKMVRYSKCINDISLVDDAQILVMDCVGLLSSLYKYGRFAYIGGGFGVGIHNILEAAAYGCPIVFGPNYRKFKEAHDLIELKGAFSFSKESELKSLFSSLISEKPAEISFSRSSQIAKEYVESHLGATDTVLREINKSLTISK